MGALLQQQQDTIAVLRELNRRLAEEVRLLRAQLAEAKTAAAGSKP